MSAATDVLFVSGTLEVGGSETKVVRVANALAEAGYAVGFAYCNPPETLKARIRPDVRVTHLRRTGKYSVASLMRLRRLLADARLAVAVNLYPLAYLVPAKRLLGGRSVGLACLINTTEFNEGDEIWGRMYAPFLRRCDRLVFGCRLQQEIWTGRYRLPAHKSTFIYNGVDAARFAPEAVPQDRAFRSRHGIPPDAVVVGSIGRLAPEKNFRALIDMVHALHRAGRDVYLLLVGDGRERSSLLAHAAELKLQGRVILPGVLEDVRPAIASMDVFVLPSRAVETFSNAALEAMAMARPVILSETGGAAEMIEHGISGLLFKPDDVARATRLLTDLVDSPGLRHTLGSNARKRVLEHFGFDAMLSSYMNLVDTFSRNERRRAN